MPSDGTIAAVCAALAVAVLALSGVIEVGIR